MEARIEPLNGPLPAISWRWDPETDILDPILRKGPEVEGYLDEQPDEQHGHEPKFEPAQSTEAPLRGDDRQDGKDDRQEERDHC